MNLLLNAALWTDQDSNEPPIWWNAEDGEYQILIDYAGSYDGVFKIATIEVAPAGSRIAFSYLIEGFEPAPEQQGYLSVVDTTTNTVMQSVGLISFPEQGEIDLVCEEGHAYAVLVARYNTNYYSSTFYDFTATLIPTPDPEEPAAKVMPWWYCTPEEPAPTPPVRADGFVPFKDYDADFRYPLASSRVPAATKKAPLEEGCEGCSPELIPYVPGTVDPDPEIPECITVDITGSSGWNYYIYESDLVEVPSWFIERSNFTIYFGGEFDTYEYTWNSEAEAYSIVAGDAFYGPETGSGILIQDLNSICITWSVPSGA